MKRVLLLSMFGLALLTPDALAQPVPGTGCPGAMPVFTSPPSPVPSPGTVFMRCPPPPPPVSAGACAFAISPPVSTPTPILPPIGCPGPCTLACLGPPVIWVPGPSFALPIPAGIPPATPLVCVQCVCIETAPPSGPCIWISGAYIIST